MFKDELLQRQFEKDGFVVVPFFSEAQVKQLSQLYEELKGEHDIIAAVHSTSDTNKPQLIRKVNNAIRQIAEPTFREIFTECKMFLCNFLVKEPGDDSEIFPHHDWTFVDESLYASASVWCPLTDVDASNGNITVLKGSHAFMDTLRASPDCPFAYDDVLDILHHYMVPLPMKAGEALIYHHAVVHGSTPNLSGSPRAVAVMGVIPEEAELYLHYRHPGPGRRKVEKFLMDTEVFINYVKHGRPQGKSLGFMDYDFKKMPRDEFLKRVNGTSPLKQSGSSRLMDRVKRAFSLKQ